MSAELLRSAIQASGLSASAYARTVLVRDPRSLRRWLAGHSPIPKAVLDFLHQQQPQPMAVRGVSDGAGIGTTAERDASEGNESNRRA